MDEGLEGRFVDPEASRLLPVASYSALAAVGGLVLSVIRAKTAAVYLGESGVGTIVQLNYMTAWVAGLAGLGIAMGCTRAIARHRARGELDTVEEIASFAFTAPLVVGVAVTGFVLLFAPFVSRVLLGDPDLSDLVLATAGSIPLTLLVLSSGAVLRGFDRIRRVATAELIASFLNTFVVVALILVWGLAGAVAGVIATSAILLLVYLAREPVSFRPLLHLRLPERSVLRSIMAVGLVTFLWATVLRTTDLVVRALIVDRLGLDDNGLYQPAYSISVQIELVLLTGTAAYLFTRLSELAGRSDRPGLLAEWSAGIRLLVMVTFPTLVMIVMFRDPIIRLLYSLEFAPAADLIPPQLAGDYFKMLGWAFVAVLLPLGWAKDYLLLAVAGRIVNIAIVASFIDDAGLVVVPWANVVDWIVTIALTVVVLWRRDLLHIEGRAIRAVLVSTMGVALLVWQAPDGTSWYGLAAGLAGLTVWAMFTVTRADLDSLRRMIARARRGSRLP